MHPPSGRSTLDQVAALVTSPALCPDEDELLVIALRPDQDNRQVIASAGNSAVRASVSVAVAAGNHRAWSTAGPGEIVDVAINVLPEIIRAAIQPSGVQSVRVATVDAGDVRACLVMWLSRSPGVTSAAKVRQATTLRNLTDAAERDLLDCLERSARDQEEHDLESNVSPAAIDDAVVDSLATLPSRSDFDGLLTNVRSDETGLIVLGIDDIDTVASGFGDDAAEQIRRTVASRLANACRRHDVVAHIGDDVFAVLLVDVDRHAAFEISKRLRSDVSQPIDLGSGSVAVSISVGLSHETGLVDPVELFVSAEAAMEDAHLAGGARMLVAG